MVEGGEPAIGPVMIGEQRGAVGMSESDIGGKILGFATEAEVEPATERWSTGSDAAPGEGVERLTVIIDAGLHGADDADVVDHFGQVGQQGGQFGARLAMFFELPEGG